MYSLNKAGLLASTIVALLVITSCSDSGTSTTGVDPLSRDAAEAGAINNAALKREDHDHGPQGHEAVGIAAPGQGEGLGHQHAEPPEVVAGTVLTLATIPASSCGNFIPEAGEMCDDGPSGSATCTANCELKTGKGGEIVAENFCGDGKRRIIDGEQCDDGNADNTDSCTQYCRFAACGDGYTQPSNGEQCDDGNKNDSDSCNNSCQRPGDPDKPTTTIRSSSSSSSWSSSSSIPRQGDDCSTSLSVSPGSFVEGASVTWTWSSTSPGPFCGHGVHGAVGKPDATYIGITSGYTTAYATKPNTAAHPPGSWTSLTYGPVFIWPNSGVGSCWDQWLKRPTCAASATAKIYPRGGSSSSYSSYGSSSSSYSSYGSSSSYSSYSSSSSSSSSSTPPALVLAASRDPEAERECVNDLRSTWRSATQACQNDHSACLNDCFAATGGRADEQGMSFADWYAVHGSSYNLCSTACANTWSNCWTGTDYNTGGHGGRFDTTRATAACQ